MSLTIKNSPNTTAQTPLVNLNGEDFPLNDVLASAREAATARVTASFEETLQPFVPPAKPASAKPAPAAVANVPENDDAGLITPK